MRRAASLLVAIAAATCSGAVLAQARGLLEICTAEQGAAEILQRLDGWMSTVRIRLRDPRRCDEPASHYVGRFERSGTSTDFVLRNPAGGILRHQIPWIGPSAAPLAEIDALQRLPQFSLLLESLLAEDRLGLAAPPPPPAEPPRPPARPPRRRRPPPPPPPVVPAPKPAQAPPEEEPVPPPPLLDLRPDPEEEPPPEEATDVHPAPVPAPTPRLEDFREPPQPRGWEWESFAAVRGRSPDFLGPEVGFGLSHGPLALRLGVQIPTRWYLGRAPIGVGSLWLAPGVGHELALASTTLRLGVALTVEWALVRRLDLPWAEVHPFWSIGPSLGAELRWPLLGGRIGVGVEVGGMPPAPNLRLPEGGEARLGSAWGRLTLRFGSGE